MNWILALFGVSWVAVFTSQTLVDLADALFVISALMLSFKCKEFKEFIKGFKPAWFWVVWLIVLLVGILINTQGNSSKAWQDFFEFRWILTLLAVIYLTTKLPNTEKLLYVWTALTILLNIASLILFIQSEDPRAAGVLKQVMSFSHNIAPAFCLFSVFIISQWNALSNKHKALVLAAALTSGLLTLLTFTRGVWIGSTIGLLVAFYLWNRKAFFKIAAVFICSCVLLIATNQKIQNRIFGRTESESQSNNERLALWKGNWRIIQDYPIFGVGIGQNKFHLRKYYDEFGYPPEQRISHAHNQYLQIWAGTGTVGLVIFLAFMFMILKETYKGIRNTSGFEQSFQLGLLAALLCFQVGGLTESNFNIAKNRHFFLVLAGVAIGQTLKNTKRLGKN